MIHNELQDAINSQINQELSASYNYLGMSNYFDAENLDGFAKWMLLQHSEEREHALKLIGYLQDRGGKVSLSALPTPISEFEQPIDAFKLSLEQEKANTASIHSLYELSLKHNDYATKSHLQWFLDEQVEEEKSVEDVIALLKRVGDDVTGLLYLDDKLGKRSADDTAE